MYRYKKRAKDAGNRLNRTAQLSIPVQISRGRVGEKKDVRDSEGERR